MAKKVDSVESIKSDLVRLCTPDGNSRLISKFQAFKYASEARMDLYVEDKNGTTFAEMRNPEQKRKRKKRRRG